MERTIKIALNRFEELPISLRNPEAGHSVGQISVNLASLYHHYYLDSYGIALPSPDPAQFEYLRFLLQTADFRLKGDGIGDCTSARRHSSTALGQAFCRWFLHDHCGITYFAHMQHVLNKSPSRHFGGLRVCRSQSGDVPDYMCSRDTSLVFLAEAKGRYTPISFKSKEFASWRKQFDRVVVRDQAGIARKLKGFIVATRLATEMNAPKVDSSISVEDPDSPGETPPREEDSAALARALVARHYAGIARKLQQHPLSAALESGVRLAEQLRVNAVVWEYQGPFLEKRRFVGGYFPADAQTPIRFRDEDGRVVPHIDHLRLDIGAGTFFGVEEEIFKQVVTLARRGGGGINESMQRISTYRQTEPFYSAISILRDGSILAPIEFLAPAEPVQY